jgi:hypothetical protein
VPYEKFFPKSAPKKRPIEGPAEFWIDAEMWEPWMAGESIEPEDHRGQISCQDSTRATRSAAMCPSRKRRRCSIAFCVAIVVVAAAQPAFAGGHESAKERSARKACLGGDYATGVSILSDLFLDTKDATHIYNQGRCLEQNGRYSEAIFRFQEYLRVGIKLSNADKSDAEKHIADCQRQLAKQNPQSEPVVVVAAPAPVAPPQPQPVAVPQPAVSVSQAAPSEPTSHGSGLRTAGLVTAGVGVAGVIAGVIFNLKVNSIADSYATRGTYTQGKESDRSTYQTLGWVSYGLGSAGIAAGAILYLVGCSGGITGSSNVALVPSVAPGTAGAMVKGSF